MPALLSLSPVMGKRETGPVFSQAKMNHTTMIKQHQHNPFALKTPHDLFEILALDEQCQFHYFHCSSFHHLEDGRLLMQRRTTNGDAQVATAAKFAKRYCVLRVNLL